MHINQIKEEIKRISKLTDSKECQRELRILNKKIGNLFIAQLRGNYAYFYRIKYAMDQEKKRSKKIILKPSLGRISKEEYNKNPKEIKDLPLNELKKRLEPIIE